MRTNALERSKTLKNVLPASTMPGYIAFEEYRLENGLHVILQEDHTSAVVCLNIAYHVGSKNEDIPRRGFAHLFEHLLFDGSAHVPRGKFDEYITQAGGHDNAYTTEDKTNYYEVLPSHQLELAFWLESDRMLEFAATEIGLATQKQVVKEEKRERYDNTPYGSLSIRMNRLAYRNYPYWWAVIGDMETIDAATLLDVQAFFERFYVPGNAVLVLAGDFEPEQARERIDRYFGSIPNTAAPIVQPPFDDPDILEERREIVDSEPVPLPAVFYTYRIPPEGTHKFLALDLLTDILSSGESSRLYRKLVYELQIASEVSAYVDGREMPGLLYLYAVHREPDGTTDELEMALNAVLSEVARHGVTERELQKAKNKVEARTIASRVTLQGRADQLAHAALFYADAGRVNTLLEEYGRITMEDIREAANLYLQKTNRCTVLYLTGEVTEFAGEITEPSHQ
jgi:zinc protease